MKIILAIDDSWGIARQGTIPWHLPADLARFKKITIGDGNNACIMGRTTYESIPEKFRPLSNRLNVVLTRQLEEIPGVIAKHSLKDALTFSHKKARDVFVIGGADVYEQCFRQDAPEVCSEIYLTRVSGDFSCDQHVVWLKKIIEKDFVKVSQEELQGAKGIFEVYSNQILKTPFE